MINTAIRVSSILFLMYITHLSRPGNSLFSWHPFLMTLTTSPLNGHCRMAGSGSGKWESGWETGAQHKVLPHGTCLSPSPSPKASLHTFMFCREQTGQEMGGRRWSGGATQSYQFTGMASEGIAMFTKHGLTSDRPHSTKVMAHWILLVAAGLCHGLAYAAIYMTKEDQRKPHLTTWHGCFGLVTSILLWGQLCAGIFSKYPRILKNYINLRSLRICHSVLGCFTFGLGMITVCLALFSAWFENNAFHCTLYPSIGLHLMLLLVALSRHFHKYVWSK